MKGIIFGVLGNVMDVIKSKLIMLLDIVEEICVVCEYGGMGRMVVEVKVEDIKFGKVVIFLDEVWKDKGKF